MRSEIFHNHTSSEHTLMLEHTHIYSGYKRPSSMATKKCLTRVIQPWNLHGGSDWLFLCLL